MKFLTRPPRFLFFTGKGGVGKTSIACAAAIQLAENNKKVLLVSTDPASNVGQVFGVTIGNHIVAIDAVDGLSALEIDPQMAAQQYRDRIVGPVRGVLPDAAVKGIEEQLSGACTTEIAAFDEFTSLLTDDTLDVKFDHVIFDTAPTGHTIRLLQLPGAWSDFLEAGKGDASCLGPLAGLEKQREQYHEAVETLKDKQRTRLVLVARAQQAALREAARTQSELAAIGIKQAYLVINGVLQKSAVENDSLATAVYRREQLALSAMPESLKILPTDEIALKPFNLVGLNALQHLFSDEVIIGTDNHQAELPDLPALKNLVDDIAADGHGLVMVMGKGGVGKTTIAAAIAVALAKRNLPVHLSTSDPAAHLAETLVANLENLTVSRIDPHVEIERYRQDVLKTKGANLDAAGVAMLEEDLRSPCTEEIAVFQAFSRTIREGKKKFVIMDTAPTGHTLILIDATGSYHRDMVRMMSASKLHYTTPLMQLQDSTFTKILIVTLAETTQVLEAADLQAELRRAGIEPWAWIINNSIAAAHTHSPLLLQRAHNELAQIETVTTQHAKRFAVVPLQIEEPVGVEHLLNLVEESVL